MKVKFNDLETLNRFQMKKNEKDTVRVTEIPCEKCGSLFEQSFKFLQKKKLEHKPVLCEKCRLSEAYHKSDAKRKQTLIQRYGCTNNLHIKSVEEKVKKNWTEKYGVDNPAKSDSVKEKMKKTISSRTEEQKNQATKKSKETRLLKYGAYFSKEKVEKTNQTLIEKYGSVEEAYKQRYEKIQKIFEEKYGTKYPVMMYSHKKYCFDNTFFDSSWELAYYIWLKDNGKQFEYHPAYLEYFDEFGKKHEYFPDFIVEGHIVEIKGDHFFNEKGEPFDKYKNCSWKSKYEFILQKGGKILRYNDVKFYLSYVAENYGNDFLKSWKMV